MTWVFYAVLSAVFASAVAIFGKLGMKEMDATLATTIRSVIMAGFLMITSFSLGKFHTFQVSSVSSKDWMLITLAGVAGALSWLCYFVALKSGPATSVSALDRLSIVFVVFLAALFLGEALSWKSLVGAAFIALGALLISWK